MTNRTPTSLDRERIVRTADGTSFRYGGYQENGGPFALLYWQHGNRLWDPFETVADAVEFGIVTSEPQGDYTVMGEISAHVVIDMRTGAVEHEF